MSTGPDASLIRHLEILGRADLLVADRTPEAIQQEVARKAAEALGFPEARLFLWFAGHGHTGFGEGYLVPADAPLPQSADFFYYALHMGDLGAMVKIARAKHVLAVFDS